MKRTEKELLMKRVGKWLGIGYRFHRRQGQDLYIVSKGQNGGMSNYPRHWEFEFWKKVPGNPRNEYFPWGYEKYRKKHPEWHVAFADWKNQDKYRLERSDVVKLYPPESVIAKDDAIDWLITESGFIQKAGGPNIKSYEELNLWLETAFVPEKI